jgi:hypothetical protein
MGIAIGKLIADLFKPAADLVDELHTSKEEKGQLQIALQTIQEDVVKSVMQHVEAIVASQAAVIIAEANSDSWLAKNWRPLIMVGCFGVILEWNFVLAPIGTWISALFGGPVFPVLPTPPELWSLLKLGLGGYVGLRSTEKIVDKWLNRGNNG